MAAPTPPDVAALAPRVEPLLRARGLPARLTAAALLREGDRNRVLRCSLDGPPGSVVAKVGRPGPTDLLWQEWAALAHLEGRGPGPRLVAADPEQGLLLLEDLGYVPTLDALLRGADEDRVRAAFAAAGRAHARLTAAGPGPLALQGRLAILGRAPADRRNELTRWRADAERFRAWLPRLGQPEPAGLSAALDHVAGVWTDPGPWLAFTHGDPAPTNTLVTDDEARLVDLEYSGYRHALYDPTAWEILCPLPRPWLAELRQVYRQTLAEIHPDLAAPAAFDPAWATLCAYRAVALLGWLPPDALETDHPWVDTWTAADGLVTTAHRLAAATESFTDLAPLAAAAHALTAALAARGHLAERLPPWRAASEPRA